MTDKELEKLFQSKLQNREVDFNPANWAAMEDMLDGKSSQAGAFYWRSVAAILCFGVLAALATLWHPQPGPNEKYIAREATPAVLDSEASSGIEESSTKARAEESLESGANAPTNISSETITPQSSPLAKNRNKSRAGVNPTEKSKPTAERMAGNANESTAGSSRLSPPPPAAGISTTLYDSEAGLDDNSLKEDETLVLLSRKDLNFEAVQAELLIAEGVDTDPRLPAGLRAMTGGPSIYFQTGSVLSSSFADGSPGVGFEVGAGYQQRFSPWLSATAGLNFVRQNNVGMLAMSDSTFYDFGKETIHTEQTTEQMSYLEMPISVNFHLSEKHQLSLSAYGSKLLNVKENHYREHSVMKLEPNITESDYSGLPDYYHEWNFGIGASYRFEVTRDFSLAIAVRKDLSDLSRDKMNTFSGSHHNFSTRIQLRYQLFHL